MRLRLKNWVFGIGIVVGIMTGGTAMAEQKTAVFAGGCFWCMQSEFGSEPGVISTTVGYTGGHVENPSYDEVSRGDTGHREAIEVRYNADVVDYNRLLEIFWSNIDPLDATGQFCDKGEQYKAAIFTDGMHERELAERSAAALSRHLGKPVVTDILPRSEFYTAEEYHQDYYKKSAAAYAKYRAGCGRDQRLEELKGAE